MEELQEQAEIIEKSILRLSAEDRSKQRVESTSMRPASKFKGKNFLVVDTPTEPKKNLPPQ